MNNKAYGNKQFIDGYMKKRSNNTRMKKFIKQFIALIDKRKLGRSLIDIGCGFGQDLIEFAKKGFSVIGIDLSKAMIHEAHKLGNPYGNLSFVQLDMRKVKNVYKENSFDVAWISASAIHLPERDMSDFLQNIKEIIKPGGLIYINLQAGNQESRTIEEDTYGVKVKRQFVFWKRDIFKKLLKKKGFGIIEYFEQSGGVMDGNLTFWMNFILEN